MLIRAAVGPAGNLSRTTKGQQKNYLVESTHIKEVPMKSPCGKQKPGHWQWSKYTDHKMLPKSESNLIVRVLYAAYYVNTTAVSNFRYTKPLQGTIIS